MKTVIDKIFWANKAGDDLCLCYVWYMYMYNRERSLMYRNGEDREIWERKITNVDIHRKYGDQLGEYIYGFVIQMISKVIL